MRIIKKIDQDIMVATFLKAEASSSRFSGRLEKAIKKAGATIDIIQNPDFSNPKEVAQRKAILKEHRGFQDNRDIFGGFPEKVEWFEVELSRGEVLGVKYIDYKYWNNHSNNSRSPIVAAEKIKKERGGLALESRDRFDQISNALQKGATFPSLILVARNSDAYLVVLEGHLRLTGFALNPSFIPDPLRVIVGLSADINQWSLY